MSFRFGLSADCCLTVPDLLTCSGTTFFDDFSSDPGGWSSDNSDFTWDLVFGGGRRAQLINPSPPADDESSFTRTIDDTDATDVLVCTEMLGVFTNEAGLEVTIDGTPYRYTFLNTDPDADPLQVAAHVTPTHIHWWTGGTLGTITGWVYQRSDAISYTPTGSLNCGLYARDDTDGSGGTTFSEFRVTVYT